MADEQSPSPLSNISPGLEFSETWPVGRFEPQTIVDGVDVVATPEIIGCMEGTVRDAVTPHLPDGYRVVGSEVECDHRAPTPAGGEVEVTVEIEAVDEENDQVVATATVTDDAGIVATGRMQHAAVDRETFGGSVERRFAELSAAGPE
ncbi:thioesterase family protein [Haloparvum sp. PAK95]|uniref:thioesterase family protein n=1 Tax=Haloparvum sp. PAK95 TaxID=3418962 RepID=UPI003D2EAFD9